LGFLTIVFIGKIMDWVYESRDHGWLSVHGGLVTMGQRGRSGAREVVVIARRKRERMSLGFSPMTLLRGGTVKMTI
jgi:hypothetical protein